MSPSPRKRPVPPAEAAIGGVFGWVRRNPKTATVVVLGLIVTAAVVLL